MRNQKTWFRSRLLRREVSLVTRVGNLPLLLDFSDTLNDLQIFLNENVIPVYRFLTSLNWRHVLSIFTFLCIVRDQRDDFNFHITNFPFLSSNIPSSPAYGVFISQLMWYARACPSYECFILRAARLSCKHLGHGYGRERLKSSLRKLYGRYGDLIKHYLVMVHNPAHDLFSIGIIFCVV